MAKVKLNPVLEAIHGKIGDLVFKTFNHNEIVGRIPDRTGVVPTANQIEQQNKFRIAVLYGKAVMADPAQKEVYDDVAARKGQAAFAVSVGDFLNAPSVDEIDMAGYTGKPAERIRIRATDDVEVKGVAVVIRAQGGAVLEQGPAVWSTSNATWDYTTTTTLAQGQSASIEVTATDIPGHKTSRTQTHS